MPFEFNNTHFVREGKVMATKDIKLKQIQSFYEFPLTPNCEQKWENFFINENIQWDKIWVSLKDNFGNRNTKQLQWKLLHNIIYTEELLQKIFFSNGSCHFCNERKNMNHLFFTCKLVKEVWKDIS